MSEQAHGPDWWLAPDGRWYPPNPEPAPPKPARRPSRWKNMRPKVNLKALRKIPPRRFLYVGAGLSALGSFMPWLRVSAPLAGSVTTSGSDTNEGGIIVLLAMAIAGLTYATKSAEATRTQFSVLIGCVAVLIGITVWKFVDILGAVSEIDSQGLGVIEGSVGFGLWMLGLGTASCATGCGLLLLDRRSPTG